MFALHTRGNTNNLLRKKLNNILTLMTEIYNNIIIVVGSVNLRGKQSTEKYIKILI